MAEPSATPDAPAPTTAPATPATEPTPTPAPATPEPTTEPAPAPAPAVEPTPGPEPAAPVTTPTADASLAKLVMARAEAESAKPNDTVTGTGTVTVLPTTDDVKLPAGLIPDKAYDILKWVAIIVLPALATFVIGLGGIWNWPIAGSVAATITAIGVLLGAVLGLSAVKYASK